MKEKRKKWLFTGLSPFYLPPTLLPAFFDMYEVRKTKRE